MINLKPKSNRTRKALLELEAALSRHKAERTKHLICFSWIDGERVSAPLSNEWVELFPSISWKLCSQNEVRTRYLLRVGEASDLPYHEHDRDETVTPLMGSMTDLKTGLTYGQDEVWKIERGQSHSVRFEQGIYMGEFRPSLAIS